MKWVLRFIVGFSYLALPVALFLVIEPEHVSELWTLVLEKWPVVVFMIFVLPIIVGDTLIGTVKELREHYRKEQL